MNIIYALCFNNQLISINKFKSSPKLDVNTKTSVINELAKDITNRQQEVDLWMTH